jgi:sigma-B regulation protein RsbU (phosphoserine phosphatase)
VDDEELNREGLARRLQKHGYEVSLAASGREAVEALGGRRFDLVLLDIMMPGMTGMEVLKFLRRVESRLDLPIIMVTAKGESEDVVEALELGANDYVTKPLDFPVVLARIRTQLSLRQAVSRVTDLEQKLDARNRELEATAAELAVAGERTRRDLAAAAGVQRAFRPVQPPQVPGARMAWAVRPAGDLAVDLLDVFPVDGRRVGVCAVDAGGPGVAAALRSVAVGRFLAGAGGAPGEALTALGRQLTADGADGHTFAALYGVLDPRVGEFRFAAAGHPGPIHLPRGGKPGGADVADLPLGVGPGHYAEHAVRLGPGDRLLVATDGLAEARNPDGEHFGRHRLLAALDRTRLSPPDECLAAVLAEADAWRGGAPAHDDLAALLVERPAEEQA